MKFTLYTQWEQVPASANELFALGAQESIFFSRVWLENLTNYALDDQQSLLLACVVDGENILAILPMIQHAEGSLSALSNRFTSLFSLLISPDRPSDEVLACLADGLSQAPVQPIQIDPIDSKDEKLLELRQAMQACGYQCHAYFRFDNWVHAVKGQSFDQYMALRPSRLRNTIARKQRKLEREHQYSITLFKDVDIEQALADYQTVYRASWKANEFFLNFTPNLIKRIAPLGWLRLGVLYINQQPVAAQIWFVVHGKASIYRLAYDEAWKKYSPGSILTQYLFQHVIDTDKVSEIDFLTGKENYKQDWMTTRRERLGIRFTQPPIHDDRFSRIIKFLKRHVSRNK